MPQLCTVRPVLTHLTYKCTFHRVVDFTVCYFFFYASISYITLFFYFIVAIVTSPVTCPEMLL